MSDVCREVGASERTLRRAFLADVGMTWREYLHCSRLLRAVALLSAGNQTLLNVAHAVGFESASTFTRAFTRYTGQTPSAYRQQVRSVPAATVPDVLPTQTPSVLRDRSTVVRDRRAAPVVDDADRC